MTLHGSGYLGAQNQCISPIPVHKSETPCISPEALSPPKNRTYTQTYARGGGGGGGGGGVGMSTNRLVVDIIIIFL